MKYTDDNLETKFDCDRVIMKSTALTLIAYRVLGSNVKAVYVTTPVVEWGDIDHYVTALTYSEGIATNLTHRKLVSREAPILIEFKSGKVVEFTGSWLQQPSFSYQEIERPPVYDDF